MNARSAFRGAVHEDRRVPELASSVLVICAAPGSMSRAWQGRRGRRRPISPSIRARTTRRRHRSSMTTTASSVLGSGTSTVGDLLLSACSRVGPARRAMRRRCRSPRLLRRTRGPRRARRRRAAGDARRPGVVWIRGAGPRSSRRRELSGRRSRRRGGGGRCSSTMLQRRRRSERARRDQRTSSGRAPSPAARIDRALAEALSICVMRDLQGLRASGPAHVRSWRR